MYRGFKCLAGKFKYTAILYNLWTHHLDNEVNTESNESIKNQFLPAMSSPQNI